MDTSSASDTGKTAYDALNTLLGVKGPFRLVPQGPTPKAHIIIKRDYPKDEEDEDPKSGNIARFSFIAGKKFTISKGQPLLFAVASPEDRDGKTLLYNDSTFMLEATIGDSSEGSDEDEPEVPKSKRLSRRERRNVETLPPKMRKSFTRQTTYESYVRKEPSSSLGFVGYPLGETTRVFSTAAVQTDMDMFPPIPPVSVTQVATPTRTPLSTEKVEDKPDKSPVQLPSPVSADHAREVILGSAQLEAEEIDDYSRIERSLSPMELSSASSSPAGSPVYNPLSLPTEVVTSPTVDEPEATHSAVPALSNTVYQEKRTTPAENASVDSVPAIPFEIDRVSSAHSEEVVDREIQKPKTSSPQSSAQQDLLIKQELVICNFQQELSGEVSQPAIASSSKSPTVESEGTGEFKSVHTIPYEVPVPRSIAHLSARAQEKLPASASITATRLPSTIPTAPRASGLSSVVRISSPPPDPKSLVYIPSVSSSNPLGIRPSSSYSHTNSVTAPKAKPVPTGPRALANSGWGQTPTGPGGSKKPVVVGANWSAARNSSLGSNSSLTNTFSSGLPSSTSSSSMSSIASTSPAVPGDSTPPSAPKAILSHMLHYGSPSPPPLSGHSQPQSGVLKWKPIALPMKSAHTAGSPITANPQINQQSQKGNDYWTSLTNSALNGPPLKRSHDAFASHSGEKQDTNLTEGQALKKHKSSSPPPLLLSPSLTTNNISRWDKPPSFVPATLPAPNFTRATLPQPTFQPTTPPPPSPSPPPPPPATITTSLSSSSSISSTSATSASRTSQLPQTPVSQFQPPTSSIPLSASSSSSNLSKTTPIHTPVTPKPSQLPAPLTHPLPPKPVASASSYHPLITREPWERDPRSGKRFDSPPLRRRSEHRERDRNRSRSRTRSVEPESKRPPVRTDWPATSCSAEYQLGPPGTDSHIQDEPSVQKITINSDGTLVALMCGDRTLRIWENKQNAQEVARLGHNMALASLCWMDGDVTTPTAVLTLTIDGKVSTWTRNGNEWRFSRLFLIPDISVVEGQIPCMVYSKDKIAVTVRTGVKVWMLINGTWQQQRNIIRSGISVVRFVQDGDALIGGCRDGVLWHCEVPNGTLRVHAFLPKAVTSIDIHPSGTSLLVAQEGGQAHLVTFKANENKGNIERTYTSEKLQLMNQKGYAAVFATRGQAILYGSVNGCALVWDRKKGTIAYGLKHYDDDPVLAAGIFDSRPGVEGVMITGTKQGRLFWWPQPVAVAPSNQTHQTAR